MYEGKVGYLVLTVCINICNAVIKEITPIKGLLISNIDAIEVIITMYFYVITINDHFTFRKKCLKQNSTKMQWTEGMNPTKMKV